MMKIVGILFILVASCGMGWEFGQQHLSELKKIKNADAVLTTILTGLENGRQTVHEIFYQIESSADDEQAKIFEQVEKSFKNGETFFHTDGERLLFGKDPTVLENIRCTFSVLGKYSAEEQIAKIQFCRENIRNRYRILDEPFRQKAKLFQSLGVLGGLFLSVILL